jgi:hypothetical protein
MHHKGTKTHLLQLRGVLKNRGLANEGLTETRANFLETVVPYNEGNAPQNCLFLDICIAPVL